MFKHNYPFDPTYGYSQDQLLAIKPPAEPAGFVEFWQKTYDQTRSVPLNITTRENPLTRDDVLVLDVQFDGLEGFRVGAWVTIPRKTPFTRGIVAGHGYGEPAAPASGINIPPAAAIHPCARGFALSAHKDVPRTPAYHVIHGIDSPHTYIHRHCVADIWTSLSVLQHLCPQITHFDYTGGSFGGGIGALALPWEPRFRKAHLSVPSFGHHPLRLTMPCAGSGEAVRIYHSHHPEIAHTTLPFLDAAIAATHIKIPVHTTPALFDPSVPPPGQFAVCNAIKSPHKQHIMPAGHFDYPEAQTHNTAITAELHDFFSA